MSSEIKFPFNRTVNSHFTKKISKNLEKICENDQINLSFFCLCFFLKNQKINKCTDNMSSQKKIQWTRTRNGNFFP